MTPQNDAFDRLLARYWDGNLSPAEWETLNHRLESDPEARRWFREVCLHAVAASDAVVPAEAADATASGPAAPTVRKISRRAALGVGVAAGLATGVLLTRQFGELLDPSPVGLLVTWTRGRVTCDGKALEAGNVVPPGSTLSTAGPTSSAVLELPDGSTLCLSADTTVRVPASGGRVVVEQGGVTADLRPSQDDEPSAMVGTSEVGVRAVAAAGVDVSTAGRETELTVQRGQVMVSAGDRGPLAVRDGELFTASADGGSAVRPAPILSDKFVLDFVDRLPEGWRVGRREETPTGPALAPDLWYDPYHAERMWQIRSQQSWVRGLVRVFPDSIVRVRYRADRTADGQVVLVVRRPRSTFKESGCLEWNGRFEACAPDEWRTLTVRAADMLDNHEGPRFAPPWVAFLLIFNTYTEDLGLRVADFRVTRPGPA
ncbi:MAG: FecR family protein [Fimbriiglobus sp.]|nr:FecR family protein [Fimbriiglobus sp.]